MTTQHTATKELNSAHAIDTPSVLREHRTGPYYAGVPEYMIDIYDWAYVNPKHVEILDRNIVVWVLLFLNAGRLMRRYLDQIRPGMRVWQVAHVYGDLVKKVAAKIGPEGTFHLTDVVPAQIEHAQRKIGREPWVRIIRQDAASYKAEQPYDLACSFFLLHEIPEEKKFQVVDRVLENIGAEGRAVFVDYHGPALLHPIRPILKFVNWWLEPFAETMWNNSIPSYASHPEKYRWNKETLFGGVYQVVTADPIRE
ncbi:MAG: rhodoquinone biosynthesis methyltransferase RquA [Methylobacteriaceae bacterium]|jgi:ubiquinone/menaquinone biosynthesis C-methylase UbiE|nr:rhodoquinone biosynthesis methyltransferase RquA [Methylobacteriaceae bacterium]